nr:M48 family metalloprotease [Campylobacter sp.]
SIQTNSLNEILSSSATNKYSKSQELAADNEALNVLNCAYGHIGGAGEFFESILQNGDRNLIENLFDTHPTLKKRIQNINNSKLPKNKAIMLNLD